MKVKKRKKDDNDITNRHFITTYQNDGQKDA